MRRKGGKESEGVKDRSKEGGKGRIIKRKGRKRCGRRRDLENKERTDGESSCVG